MPLSLQVPVTLSTSTKGEQWYIYSHFFLRYMALRYKSLSSTTRGFRVSIPADILKKVLITDNLKPNAAYQGCLANSTNGGARIITDNPASILTQANMTHQICFNFFSTPQTSGDNEGQLYAVMSIDNSVTCRCGYNYPIAPVNSTTCTLPAGGNPVEIGGGRDSVSAWRINAVRRLSHCSSLKCSVLCKLKPVFTPTKVGVGKYDCASAQPTNDDEEEQHGTIHARYTPHHHTTNRHPKTIGYGSSAWICETGNDEMDMDLGIGFGLDRNKSKHCMMHHTYSLPIFPCNRVTHTSPFHPSFTSLTFIFSIHF
jgi:hypothetical protein